MTELTKVCTKCGKELPATNEYFSKVNRGKYGLKAYCKKCGKIYRESKKNPKIYKITHTPSNKIYIGQTVKPLNERISNHFSHAKLGFNLPLQVEIRKENLSKSNFKFEVLEYASSESELDDLERKWIKYYKDLNVELYNIESGGNSGDKGKVISEESKVKISKANKGKFVSKETRNKISKANKGKKKLIGSNNPMAKIDEDIALKIIKLLINKVKPIEISEMIGVNSHLIGDINRRKSWKHITVEGYEDIDVYYKIKNHNK